MINPIIVYKDTTGMTNLMMDSSVSLKDEIWFLRVCHHISNAVFYFRRKGKGLFHLPLEHTITNLLSHERDEILKMLLVSQGNSAVWLQLSHTIMLYVTALLLQCEYKGITQGSAYVFSFLSTIGRLT